MNFVRSISKSGWLIIIIGSIIWSLTMVKSGIEYDYGMGFWGPNGHDGVWHIALAESLSRGSYEMPTFAGEELKNYHIGFDLFLSMVHKLTGISVHNLYFQVFPPVFALSAGIFVYKFVHLWKKSKSAAFWSTFFLYFGGSFGWVVTLSRSGEIGGESMFWAQQSISTLINPPFAFSIVMIFAGLYSLMQFFRLQDRRYAVLSTFLFGLLIFVKVYAGILMLLGLFIAGFAKLIKREGVDLVKIYSGALILSLLFFLPVNSGAQSLVEFKPFWFLQSMMTSPDRVGWERFASAMINYQLGGVWGKLIVAYLAAFAIFIIGNFGTRLISLIYFVGKVRNKKGIDYMDLVFVTALITGIIVPLFFVQRGTPWNTIQFMYYSLIISGILAGIVMSGLLKVLKSRPQQIVLISFVVLVTIPTTLGTLAHYLPARPPAKISTQELEALSFLRAQPEGVVLTQPFDEESAKMAAGNPPRPLYLYESTAYVSAFSGKPVFLEDQVNLEITGYDWRVRKDQVELFFSSGLEEYEAFIDENEIKYIYIVKGLGYEVDDIDINMLFENELVSIYGTSNDWR